MKDYKAIFFDLDGTLLPMDMDVFAKTYFKELCISLAKYGVSAEKLIEAVWAGTKEMVLNDGSCKNEKRFWDKFLSLTGIVSDTIFAETDYFYSHEFNKARVVTGENPLAVEAVRAAAKGGRKVVLATNPLFPYAAQLSRISWIGLKEDDFVLITSYESDSFCKPNPNYYIEICRRIGVEPGDCLMIGNDINEDMIAAEKAGMDAYLVKDCLISGGKSWEGPSGSFEEMLEMIKKL
ncbi:MAG: HAD family hydrolase [Ruminococcaceae bacterium]|nr:HAD family hydrolase [Oscillospiraceae bacterium]